MKGLYVPELRSARDAIQLLPGRCRVDSAATTGVTAITETESGP